MPGSHWFPRSERISVQSLCFTVSLLTMSTSPESPGEGPVSLQCTTIVTVSENKWTVSPCLCARWPWLISVAHAELVVLMALAYWIPHPACPAPVQLSACSFQLPSLPCCFKRKRRMAEPPVLAQKKENQMELHMNFPESLSSQKCLGGVHQDSSRPGVRRQSQTGTPS